VAVEGPSLKTLGELALQAREEEWQQAKANFYQLRVPLSSCCQLKGRAVTEDSFTSCLFIKGRGVLWQARTLQGYGSRRWGHTEGLPLLLSAQSWGQSRDNQPKSLKAASCRNPHPQCQTNKQNKGNEKWGWEDKPNQNPLTSCPGRRVRPVAGARARSV
jgi:hypothetical protein